MLEEFLAQQPIAVWNTARGVWETQEANLFCEHWGLWQEVWPTSGMTVDGQVFALPTLAHPTTDSVSLSSPIPEESLLRSPKASEGGGGGVR